MTMADNYDRVTMTKSQWPKVLESVLGQRNINKKYLGPEEHLSLEDLAAKMPTKHKTRTSTLHRSFLEQKARNSGFVANAS